MMPINPNKSNINSHLFSKGLYVFTDWKWNIGNIIVLPTEGYRWLSKVNIVEVKNQRVLFCLDMWSRVVKFKSRKNATATVVKSKDSRLRI